jgi:hypothetical protein
MFALVRRGFLRRSKLPLRKLGSPIADSAIFVMHQRRLAETAGQVGDFLFVGFSA